MRTRRRSGRIRHGIGPAYGGSVQGASPGANAGGRLRRRPALSVRTAHVLVVHEVLDATSRCTHPATVAHLEQGAGRGFNRPV